MIHLPYCPALCPLARYSGAPQEPIADIVNTLIEVNDDMAHGRNSEEILKKIDRIADAVQSLKGRVI